LRINNIVIIGGGTAGYLSALMLSFKTNYNITIIKSPNISEIGVGESTVGSFISMIQDECGINMDEFNSHVRPVTKHGIEFDFGYKPFHYTFDNAFDSQEFKNDMPVGFDFKGGNYGNSQLSRHMIEKTNSHPNPQSLAFHIENKPFLNYLEKVLLSRGVKIISEEITDIKRDGDIIQSLNNEYEADYFIDCSGFKSILSNSEWYSYNNMLVNDRALFFQKRLGDSVRPYTKCTTMNSGWLWEIDHEDKTSCGYVYSSKHITDDKAKSEAESKLDIIIDNSRVIKFKSGRLKEHWIGNVITLGNSDGFVEPLESTSIMAILSLSSHIIDVIRCKNNDDLIKKYNVFVNNYLDTIRDFVFIHFAFNKKLDTDYWKDCRSRSGLLQSGIGSELLEYYKTNNTNIKFLSHMYINENPFALEGWWSLFRGLDV
jgi:tryptophan 7-halogenase